MIIVSTQLGTGGIWHTEAALSAGPLNLLRAVRIAQDAEAKNRQIGGYRTVLEIDGHPVISTDWPLTLADARQVLSQRTPCPLYTDPDRPGQLVEVVRPVPEVDGVVIVRPVGSTDPAAEFRAWLEDLVQVVP